MLYELTEVMVELDELVSRQTGAEGESEVGRSGSALARREARRRDAGPALQQLSLSLVLSMHRVLVDSCARYSEDCKAAAHDRNGQ